MSIRSILLVDDCSPFLKIVRRRLQGLKRTAHIAATPNAALRLVKKHQLDLALVDFYIRDHRGTDLIVELRRMHPGLVAVIYSGLGTNAAIERTNELHIPWFEKDIEPVEVIRRIEQGHSGHAAIPAAATLADVKRQFFKNLVAAHGGNVSRAAALSESSRSTIQRHIRPAWLDDDANALCAEASADAGNGDDDE